MLPPLYALTADLLDAFQRERQRRLSASQYLAVQELLRRLPADYPLADLPLLLIPVLAHNPAEQEQLTELFAVCWRAREGINFSEQYDLLPSTNLAKLHWKWRILIPVAVLLLIVVAGLAYWFWPSAPLTEVEPNHIQTIDEPTPTLLVAPTNPWEAWLAIHWLWVGGILLLLFTLLLGTLWRYLERRRRKYIMEQGRHHHPPYILSIHIEGTSEVALGNDFAHTLQVLRRRAGSDVRTLDLPRTIYASAKGGGMAKFHYRQHTQPVDYLLLIDRQNSQNHRTYLFDCLYQALRAQEIEIARFFYDADLRICYNEEHPQGISLNELQGIYGLARLMLIGTGMQMLHPVTGRLAAWTGLLTSWKERVLLTPKALLEWGQDERRLAELLPVLPATLQSLSFWAEELEQGQDARFEEWQDSVKDVPLTPVHPNLTNPLSTLQLVYNDRQLCWIAACAIYPTLHWDLTIWFGRFLSNSGEPDLVTLDNLLHLFRLPWYIHGEIPQEARIVLIDWLEAYDPALLLKLRIEVAGILAQNSPPVYSAAWDGYRLYIALQEWLIYPASRDKKKLEQEITQLLAAGVEADITVIKALKRPQTSLDFVVPDAWKQYLNFEVFPATNWRDLFKPQLLWQAVSIKWTTLQKRQVLGKSKIRVWVWFFTLFCLTAIVFLGLQTFFGENYIVQKTPENTVQPQQDSPIITPILIKPKLKPSKYKSTSLKKDFISTDTLASNLFNSLQMIGTPSPPPGYHFVIIDNFGRQEARKNVRTLQEAFPEKNIWATETSWGHFEIKLGSFPTRADASAFHVKLSQQLEQVTSLGIRPN